MKSALVIEHDEYGPAEDVGERLVERGYRLDGFRVLADPSAPSTSDSIRFPDRNGKAAEVGGGKRSSRSAAVGSGAFGTGAT